MLLNISTPASSHEGGFQENRKVTAARKKKAGVKTKEFSKPVTEYGQEDDSDSSVELIKKYKADANKFSKQKQSQHISSLFTKNPEIKAAESKEVFPVCEAVFSNDLFKDIGDVHPFTVKTLEESFGVTRVTTVQKLAMPALLAGSDALVRSQTGSGKTLAYAVPIVESLHRIRPKLTRSDGIKAVVVLPTRELALQTYECFVKLTKSFQWVVPGLVVGGEKRKSEKARLRKGITILVGTPGRLNDHAQHTQAVSLAGVRWLVLDEADRLLDLGYEKEITSLVEQLDSQCEGDSGRRQTVLLSATLTPRVERLAGLALRAAARLDASDSNASELVTPQGLANKYVVTPAKLRLVTLAAFIHWKCKVDVSSKMLVFMATQDMVDFHCRLLSTVLSGSAQFLQLHGSMTQADRTSVFQTFKTAESGVLLCTDVAARGLDLPSVDWIVQYTAPATPADYVHRVGRTARAGLKGAALLFLVPSETGFVERMQEKRIRIEEEQMGQCLQNLQMIEWEDDDRVHHGLESAATALQLRFETAVADQKSLHSLACKAYASWVRFYSSYPKEARECFKFQELHLGHFAKSFALRDPPSAIGGVTKRTDNNKRFGGQGQGQGGGGRARAYSLKGPPKLKAHVSEFDSGLEPLKKKRKMNT